jgi:hypothetical protein
MDSLKKNRGKRCLNSGRFVIPMPEKEERQAKRYDD